MGKSKPHQIVPQRLFVTGTSWNGADFLEISEKRLRFPIEQIAHNHHLPFCCAPQSVSAKPSRQMCIRDRIHGVTWSLFAKKGWKAIDFGFIAKYLTPYCTCGEPLPFWGYVIGILMPTLILGVGVYLIGLFAGSYAWALWGLLNILAGGGDLAVLWRIRKRRKSLILDHPYQVGCVAFDKQ